MLVRDLCLLHGRKGMACAIAAFAPAQPEFLPDLERLKGAGTALYVPQRVFGKFGRVKHFRGAYADFRPDAVFAHSVLPGLYGKLALPLGSERPRFATVLHSASNDDFDDWYLSLIERFTRRRAHRIIAVSEEGAGNYRRRFGHRLPVGIIPNGIDIERFRSVDRNEARRRLGIADGMKIILQVGRISKVKQQDLSVRALSGLLRTGGAELWLAGPKEDEEYLASILEQVRREGLEGRVKFLGSRPDVPELLAASDLYLMPSTAEAHSVALLEALASGVPAVLSDIAAFAAYRGWPGVETIPVGSANALREKSERLLAAGRHEREMTKYSIEATAGRYGTAASEGGL
jgi:L-malate glycosyltransferase